MKIRRPVITNTFIALSMILFLVSLAMPAIYFGSTRVYSGTAVECSDFRGQQLPTCGYPSYSGIGVLLQGWFSRSPAWFANLLLPVLWLDMKRTKLSGSLGRIASIGGSLLALSSLLVRSVPNSNWIELSNFPEPVQSLGSGFYLWTASFLVCIVAYGIGAMLSDKT